MDLGRLLRELLATFPGLFVTAFPFRNAGGYAQMQEMIAAREGFCMPDGLPFFDYFCEIEMCTHAVHPALDAWLAMRGWYLERYDEAWYLPSRMPTDEDRAEWARLAQEAAIARIGPPTHASLDPCPF